MTDTPPNGADLRQLQVSLSALCARVFDRPGEAEGLARLTAGANMETWSFDFGTEQLILRRLPAGAGDGCADEDEGALLSELEIEQEAAIVAAAGAAGVSTPEVLAVLSDEDGLGRGFVMRRISGETLPKRIQKKEEFARARDKFVADCAHELACIQGTPVEGVIAELPILGPAGRVKSLRGELDAAGAASVMLEGAHTWLRANTPSEVAPPRLVHGDFRLGNLMVGEDGVRSVLDWELAHLGDPAEDLAYVCVPSWRFANYDKPVGGIGEIGDFLAAYKRECGIDIEQERLRFWIIARTLWWGIGCLSMIGFWRSGADRSLERTVIGRRVSEVELDLLLLMEGDRPDPRAAVDWRPPVPTRPRGPTAHSELSVAIREWIEADVAPVAKGRDQFQARVAMNALGMLERRLSFADSFEAARRERLEALGLSKDALLKRACTDGLDLADPDLLRHLRLCTLEGLFIDQPNYPGLEFARRKWAAQ